MTMKQITEYLDKKIEENENFIKITFYELRVKLNLTQEETIKMLELAKTRLENMSQFFVSNSAHVQCLLYLL